MHTLNYIASISTLLAIFTSISAAPTSSASIEVTQSLTKRVCAAAEGCPYCTYKNNFLFNSWGIHLPDDKAIDATCGGGVLDNMRGQCGSITNWQCVYDNDGAGPGAWMYFNTYTGCLEYSVEAALKAAGSSKNMYQDVICGPEP